MCSNQLSYVAILLFSKPSAYLAAVSGTGRIMLIPAKSVNSFFEYLEKIRLFVGYLDELDVCRAKQLLLCVLVRLKAIKQHC
ncbi:hypothetical protein C9I99_18745 [Photobacterium lutimaris]|uniref:Uncharacterized protein n=1 Tax=Photobacterium lutimaris TaxID=388278 RepID=A0A2T3IUY9_9GAMM|nr:hypothetical protein C9I99_18745 [Photobacterium lutimaris]